MESFTSQFYFATIYTKLLALVVTAMASFILAALIFILLRVIMKQTFKDSAGIISENFRFAFYFLFVVSSLNLVFPLLEFTHTSALLIGKALYIAFVAAFAYVLIRMTFFVKALIYSRSGLNNSDALSRRKIRTQVEFLQKIAAIFIVLIAISVVLMSFEEVRELGTSILASAGIAGLVVGLAAQKSISNLLAGFQIAFTQPIRIDDVVVVENERGTIEEITLTYVIVQLIDLRRLVLPISYFIDKPFENWTRVSPELLSHFNLYVDFTFPVDELRKELMRLLSQSPLWDKKVSLIHVTDATDRSMQLRVLFSAPNSAVGFELSCKLREQLITYVQQNYPQCLPRAREENL